VTGVQTCALPISVARKLRLSDLAIGGIWGVLPTAIGMWLFHPLWGLSLIVSFGAKLYLGYVYNKRMGGYTGDGLGAVQQISEVLYYLTILIVWRLR